MSFKTQRLTNRFPLWTKVRTDASSLGSRLMSCFAEGLELNAITSQMLIEEFNLNKRRLGRAFLYEFILDAEQQLTPVLGANGYSWTYPSITGVIGISEYSIERVSELSEMTQAVPTRLTLSSSTTSGERQLWISSNPFVYSEFSYPERLWITIEGSTSYVHKTEHTDRDKSGLSRITLVGVDADYNEIVDSIQIYDDGVYVSHFAFKELTRVDHEGFNGTITVSAGPVNTPYEEDPYRTLVFEDFDGPLHLILEPGENSFLSYETNRLKLGSAYRRPGINIADNSETLASLLLVDTESNPYQAVSFCLSPENGYVYVLDDTGFVHIYVHTLPEPAAPSVEETLNTYVEITPVRGFAKYSETEPLWTRFARVRHPIAWIKIYRIKPDGTTQHLQADKTTWSNTEARISYPGTGRQKTSDWHDFRFETEYDAIGVWEYVCIVKTSVDTTTFVTEVVCGALVAKATLDTGVLDANLVYFSDSGQLTVDNGSNSYFMNEHIDKYLIDERSGKIWLSDEYDSVLVEN